LFSLRSGIVTFVEVLDEPGMGWVPAEQLLGRALDVGLSSEAAEER
jgi:hypothetical protein